MFSDLRMQIVITDEFTVQLHIDDFVLNIDKVENSTIGNVNLDLLSIIIGLFEGVLKVLLNLILSRGMDLRWLLNLLKINFIEFEKTHLEPENGYFILYLTVIFNIGTLMPRI